MAKYTVNLSKAYIRYEKASFEVEADEYADAELVAEMAIAEKPLWEKTEGEYLGHMDIEVSSEHAPTISWRED